MPDSQFQQVPIVERFEMWDTNKRIMLLQCLERKRGLSLILISRLPIKAAAQIKVIKAGKR